MDFDSPEGCTWEMVFQKTVLGPFAPKCGWIWHRHNGQLKVCRLPVKRQSTSVMAPGTHGKLERAVTNSYIGKLLKSAEIAQLQQLQASVREELEVEKSTRREAEKERLRKGRMWSQCDRNRVQTCGALGRRASEPRAALEALLDPEADFLPRPRCRSTAGKGCIQYRGGYRCAFLIMFGCSVEYIFKIPKPYEIVKERTLREEIEGKRRVRPKLPPMPCPKKLTRQSFGAFALPAGPAVLRPEGKMTLEVPELAEVKQETAQRKATLDLMRSSTIQRRATLKLAIQDAAGLHIQLSTFFAGLPAQKDKTADPQDSSRSSSSKSSLAVSPRGAKDRSPRKATYVQLSPKPNKSSFCSNSARKSSEGLERRTKFPSPNRE